MEFFVQILNANKVWCLHKLLQINILKKIKIAHHQNIFN